jgi:hypothetical protein
MLLVVRTKRQERDYELDEVICEPLLGRASVQLMSFPMLHGCHGPIVSNAPIPDLPALAPKRGSSTLSGLSLHVSTSAAREAIGLFDHLVGKAEDRWRDRQAERPGGLEIDDQLEFC